MYAKFFGLQQDPFSIAPDPHYLFMSERHREALAHLLYGLEGGGGFVLLTGEIGTGKTTVCRCFLEQIPAQCNVAYIFNPKLSVLELLRSICDEFHIQLPAGAATAKDLIDPLNEFLLRGHAASQNNVLIIDEAQNLSADVLEQLRLLTNLETNERKLLQIVLIGQPELRRLLARPELEQLAQRVIARFHLEALSAQETGHYIAHRLAVAGMNGALPFDGKALARIHQLARGVPRRINLLCGRALLGAYATGTARVDRRMVDKAAGEVFGRPQRFEKHADQKAFANWAGTDGSPVPPERRWFSSATSWAGLAGFLLGAALLGVLLWSMQRGQLRATSAPLSAMPAAVPARAASATPTSAAAGASMPRLAASAPTMSAELLSAADFNASFASGRRTQNEAWQALGQAWGLALDEQDPCRAALRQRVNCFTSNPASLALIRQLNRPGIVTLFDDKNRPTYALLTGLSEQTATLRLGEQSHKMSLPALAQIWRGEFATLWRAPDGYPDKSPSTSMKLVNDWLAAQLSKVAGPPQVAQPGDRTATAPAEPALREKIYAFQLARGLTPDGQAGPLTLMQLNRAAGLDEPQLQNNVP